MSKRPLYRAYWEAIERTVCSVCLDRADDGSCGLTRRTCAIERHLPEMTKTLSAVQSPRMDEYVAAVEAEICARCPEQVDGRCRLREAGDCALHAFLPLVLDAVEDVRASGLAP